jgi:hypothetical protein
MTGSRRVDGAVEPEESSTTGSKVTEFVRERESRSRPRPIGSAVRDLDPGFAVRDLDPGRVPE